MVDPEAGGYEVAAFKAVLQVAIKPDSTNPRRATQSVQYVLKERSICRLGVRREGDLRNGAGVRIICAEGGG